MQESAAGVRPAKAALSSGCETHPATAPGSNRSSGAGISLEIRILSNAPEIGADVGTVRFNEPGYEPPTAQAGT
jgi:hypothetical protein